MERLGDNGGKHGLADENEMSGKTVFQDDTDNFKYQSDSLIHLLSAPIFILRARLINWFHFH